MIRRTRLPAATLSVVTLTGGLGSAAATASTAAAGTAAPTTSESAKLDRVPVPDLAWFNCYRTAQCATVRVPLDYDEPDGRTTTVAALRLPATGDKIGTLFVNPAAREARRPSWPTPPTAG